jgi:hypothetical protein
MTSDTGSADVAEFGRVRGLFTLALVAEGVISQIVHEPGICGTNALQGGRDLLQLGQETLEIIRNRTLARVTRCGLSQGHDAEKGNEARGCFSASRRARKIKLKRRGSHCKTCFQLIPELKLRYSYSRS